MLTKLKTWIVNLLGGVVLKEDKTQPFNHSGTMNLLKQSINANKMTINPKNIIQSNLGLCPVKPIRGEDDNVLPNVPERGPTGAPIFKFIDAFMLGKKPTAENQLKCKKCIEDSCIIELPLNNHHYVLS